MTILSIGFYLDYYLLLQVRQFLFCFVFCFSFIYAMGFKNSREQRQEKKIGKPTDLNFPFCSMKYIFLKFLMLS